MIHLQTHFVRIALAIPFAVNMLAGPVYSDPNETTAVSIHWQKLHLNREYYCDGITAADINQDGHIDVIAGPFWYAGPRFQQRHAYYQPVPLPPEKSPSDCMLVFTHDFNDDGWTDILVQGRVHMHEAFWYENPKNESVFWKKHFVFERIQGESPTLVVDANSSRSPKLICHWENRWGWVTPQPNSPTDPWRFRPIGDPGDWPQFYHGTGVGDINQDGLWDVILNDGWYQQPAGKQATWKFHATRFSPDRGGAQMHVYDVDGDGDNDVITSLHAHEWGLAWFEQIKPTASQDQTVSPKFVMHKIMGGRIEEDQYGVAFSQPHALELADIDGDGLKDIVVGKRRWAHGPTGDVEPDAAPVVYWFQLERTPTGAQYTPRLIDRHSGVGVQIAAVDVDGNGRTDVLTASKLGTFLFLNQTK
ncbi:MAG: VCBS repeat-containing protein [Planctomycetales bacterium]|nr:VCBS repeat-containing protein [Planctomycetales bacterium]